MSCKHWSEPFLPGTIGTVTPLAQGLQHQTDLVTLCDGRKWVCKLFASRTWLGVLNHDVLEMTEEIACQVAEKLRITSKAYHPGCSNRLRTTDNRSALIKRHVPGETRLNTTPADALKLGNILARIHALKLYHPLARPFPVIDASWLDKDEPFWLKPYLEACHRSRYHRSEEWVVSHRDLYQQNIIWTKDDTPHLLDWESSGLIHPFVELIGLAVNCAGIVMGQFDRHVYAAVLQGYADTMPGLPKDDDILWTMTMHSWLLWYVFCVRSGGTQEKRATLAIMEKLLQWQPEMKALYAHLCK